MMITTAQKCLAPILSFGENNLNKDKTRLNPESEALHCATACLPTENNFVVNEHAAEAKFDKKASSA